MLEGPRHNWRREQRALKRFHLVAFGPHHLFLRHTPVSATTLYFADDTLCPVCGSLLFHPFSWNEVLLKKSKYDSGKRYRLNEHNRIPNA